jgi:TDG/mug DNA glycosylase family protein
MRVLLVGINPSLYSAAVGHHFARPGNRFWKAMHGAGFTQRQLDPDEDAALLDAGVGITNLVARATARADELATEELLAGRRRLERLVRKHHPEWVAPLGLVAYRTAFRRPGAGIGPQTDRIGEARVWLLPNPSGLNAHHQLPELTAAFRRFRVAARLPSMTQQQPRST